MQRTSAMQAPAIVFRKMFPAALLVCLGVSGCNTCYSGFWNGNGSGVTVSNTSCPLAKATGTVIVGMSTVSMTSTASAAFPSPPAASGDIQHIFLTLRGIEARPGITADEASSGWQELAPDLASHPVQFDLLAENGDSRLAGSPDSLNFTATVPADEYRQLRLRLVPLHPSPDEIILESNDCGNVGWNCVLFADRSVRPLEFDGAVPEIHITLAHGTNSLFRVLPDEVIHLSIEFDPASSVFYTSNAGVRLVPVFRVVPR